MPQISPFSKTQLHVLLLPTVLDDSCGEQLLLLSPPDALGDERLSDLTTLLLLVVTTLDAVAIRLGGRGVWGRLALTPSTLLFFAAVAVVPAGSGGDVKIVVAAFVHGAARLVRLKVWPGLTGVSPLTEAPGGNCSALSPLILIGMAPWGRVIMFLE